MKRVIPITLVMVTWGFAIASGQVVLSGRLSGDRLPGIDEQVSYSGIYCFANLARSGAQARSFRTWETVPTGWYRIAGPAGNHTMVFTGPSHFMRPIVLNNLFTESGQKLTGLNFSPNLDYAVFEDRHWDSPAALQYYQPFVASGSSITQVGFRVASDGVDGQGPGAQNLLLSVHRRTDGQPDSWPQVGPTRSVLGVDSGGPKNYLWAAGWDSGEVPTKPGTIYAVRLRAETVGGRFQPFWRPRPDPAGPCYRVGEKGGAFRDASLWMGISSDGDGVVIPYNKKVQREFGLFAGFGSRWLQTYKAQGRSLASVILYAAVGGSQPPLNRQRVMVRVRRGGVDGPVVGREKIGVGNGNYTGDASWGVFGVAFAPGEVPLIPGGRYAIEIESIENYETLNNFINIKGQVSDARAGFNPYRKHERDSYEHGTAYRSGTAVEFDLDMQVLEYEFPAGDFESAVEGPDLLVNGNMEINPVTSAQSSGWTRFSLVKGTTSSFALERAWETNHVARVVGGGLTGSGADGGYVQHVTGLDSNQTYRLSGMVRASWAVDDVRQCYVGVDRTGQVDAPSASTIEWTLLPGVHGRFVDYRSGPVRPLHDSVSVWLRGRTTQADGLAFKADFDNFALRRVKTSPPRGGG